MVKLDAEPEGGIAFDPKFFIDWPKGHLPHQVRLAGRRLLVGFLLLSVSSVAGDDAPSSGPGSRSPGSGCFTASIRRWAGCLRSRSGCTATASGVVLVALVPIALGHAVAVALVLAAALALGARARRNDAAAACRHRADRLGALARVARPSHAGAGRHADRPCRPRALVVPDGERARRRPDAGARRHAALPCGPPAPDVGRGSLALARSRRVGVHTAAMLAAIGAIALVVYRLVGLAFLRRGWINLDLVWTLSLLLCGVALLVV